MRVFVFGLGYSSAAVVERLRGRCEWIGGTTRSPEKAGAMAARGIEPFLFDGVTADPALAEAARTATHVLVSISPFTDRHHIATGTADPVLNVFGGALRSGPEAAARSVVYLSTIGVYGDAGGRWVDENDPAEPRGERAVARRIAEASWLDHERETGAAVAVLRLSGIYGPGRNTFVNLAAGTARRLVKPGQVFNRIHVDDIAQAVERCFERRATGVLNITDDEPAPPQDVIAYAASLMGIEPPPEQDFATAELSPMARSFYGANKRVSNALSKTALGMEYEWPNYRQALARMWAEGSWR
jgi:nucleoside-diphosphate-sugar epimerase